MEFRFAYHHLSKAFPAHRSATSHFRVPDYYPQRIVCLTEETTEMLYLLGEQDRIVGISGFTVRPVEARREKPRVSAFTSAKIDRIVDLRPDLVLGFSDLQADIAAELIRRAQYAGAATVGTAGPEKAAGPGTADPAAEA